MNVPRRNQMQSWCPAEHRIYEAVQAVEEMAADVRLTDAVVLLGAARDRVADFIDGVEGKRTVPGVVPSAPSPDESPNSLQPILGALRERDGRRVNMPPKFAPSDAAFQRLWTKYAALPEYVKDDWTAAFNEIWGGLSSAAAPPDAIRELAEAAQNYLNSQEMTGHTEESRRRLRHRLGSLIGPHLVAKASVGGVDSGGVAPAGEPE